jgi:hypothetical protein
LAGILNSKYGIPASREDLPVMDMKATPLVLALLALLTSEKDSLAKAQIALLTEELPIRSLLAAYDGPVDAHDTNTQ